MPMWRPPNAHPPSRIHNNTPYITRRDTGPVIGPLSARPLVPIADPARATSALLAIDLKRARVAVPRSLVCGVDLAPEAFLLPEPRLDHGRACKRNSERCGVRVRHLGDPLAKTMTYL